MPPPPSDALLGIGPLVLRWYPLLIALGIFVAMHFTGRVLERKGYSYDLSIAMVFILVPLAIIYTDDWVRTLPSAKDAPLPSEALLGIGPLVLRWYPLLIALGIFVAMHLTGRELERKGYSYDLSSAMAIVVVPLAIIGARFYHVITTYEHYTDNWIRALQIWHGGIGMPGAIAGGALGLFIMSRYYRLPWQVTFDAIAPGLILAQAIGRWGNYFNQELFGGPTMLPWGLEVTARLPAEFADIERFHPTFLYECLWNVALFALLWYLRPLDRWWPRGTATLVYLSGYGLVRLWLETVRIDTALLFGPIQLGEAVFGPWRHNFLLGGLAFLVFGGWLAYRLYTTWRERGPPPLFAATTPAGGTRKRQG